MICRRFCSSPATRERISPATSCICSASSAGVGAPEPDGAPNGLTSLTSGYACSISLNANPMARFRRASAGCASRPTSRQLLSGIENESASNLDRSSIAPSSPDRHVTRSRPRLSLAGSGGIVAHPRPAIVADDLSCYTPRQSSSARRRVTLKRRDEVSTIPATARLSADQIRERIARLPRVRLAFTPTPLEEVPRFSEALAGPRILIKRDDLTGFAFGGNKVRAMEFRMADVQAKGCNAFVLVNIGQSNHARLHAAACARLGIKMVIVKPGPKNERIQGNLLLNHITGAEIVETGTTDPAELERILDDVLEDLRRRGYKPYASTREKFSPIAGTIAFTEASIELAEQLSAARVEFAHVFLVGGTSSAGLGLGGKLLGAPYQVHAVSVGGSREALLKQVVNLGNRVATEVLDLS